MVTLPGPFKINARSRSGNSALKTIKNVLLGATAQKLLDFYPLPDVLETRYGRAMRSSGCRP